MILIDTGPLVALCDGGDSLHVRARVDFKQLREKEFGICTPVAAEALFHLRAKHQRVRMRELLVKMDASLVRPAGEEGHWGEIFDWMLKYAEHRPDLADAYLVALSSQDRKAKVWTYDGEFRTLWRRRDGSKVPLAVA